MSMELHTSERTLYKRCRRKWDLLSLNRQNLQSKKESVIHLWFGTGFHFGLEDYHGYNRFGHPFKAFMAYVEAFERGHLSLPEGVEEHVELAQGMYDHYLDWNEGRDEFHTVWIDGIPQVEVNALIPLPEIGEDVTYSVTFDRVMTDTFGRWWICDYKTAAQIDQGKLETDPQITSYLLFAPLVYPDQVFEGMVFQQFRKTVPKPPVPLKTGGFSLNKNQSTSYGLYLRTLKHHYGKVPRRYLEFLQMLKDKETHTGDNFIQRNFVRRSPEYLNAEIIKIVLEAKEMMRKDLPLYPNPTRDCMWDCPVRSICLAMDDALDWKAIRDDMFEQRPEEAHWREHIQYPEQE